MKTSVPILAALAACGAAIDPGTAEDLTIPV